MLTVENLSVSVGDSALLHDVSAQFAPGRITAIVGPNGAGKSTLLSCLAGLHKPDRGQVLIDDVPLGVLSGRERAKRIGYLPQDAPLHWNITVRALVALSRFPHGDARSATGSAAIDRALTEMALMPLANRLAGTLSGGERARAMLARVLAGEPGWILADEPLAALDVAHRFALMTRLRAIAAQGIGVIVVAHDLLLAARFADDAVLLDHGGVVAAGPAMAVLSPARLAPIFGVDFTYAATDSGPLLVSLP